MTSPVTYDDKPTEEEIRQAAVVLRRLQPGFLPKDIFLETSRLCTTPIVELVPVRDKDGRTEVLLFRRPDDDPNWPKQMHTPGTVVRATDVGEALATPLQRIYTDELQTQPRNQPVFVGMTLHQVNRGTELATIMYQDMTNDESPVGEWFPANSLPEDIVETQKDFIAQAVQKFEMRSIA